MRTFSFASLLSILIAGAVEAQTLTYTRFLVPFYGPNVVGANGSVWQVNTWVHYSGSEAAQFVPYAVCRPVICPLGVLYSPGREPLPVVPIGGLGESGVLFHVDSRYASHFTFASRIRDLSRQGESAGTEVPVVREDRIFPGTVQLLNVPVGAGFRNMLRVYALPEAEAPEAIVRYYRMPDPEGSLGGERFVLLRTERVALRTYPATEDFRLQPSLAQVGNFDRYPELLAEKAVWIEVEPATPELRVWAFVSVTNNETQQVTLITPVGR
jgi:hypothetical protein